MKLIYLLVKELPKRGGWPDDSDEMQQSQFDSEIYTNSNILRDFHADCRADDCGLDKPVIRSQYESALAASDGWIEWGGGECPVDGDVVVDVKYNGHDGVYTYTASTISWSHVWLAANIIAYRPHRGINSRANDYRLEQDLDECIGQDVDVPEWNGDGLPPVGCECEVKRAVDWVKCKILFISDTHVVLMADEECCWNTCACQFRPLRTEAEKAREAACRSISHILDEDRDFQFDAKKIYDAIAAGKIPGVKLEEK